MLPAQNDACLNAGLRALVAFTADNADIKFLFRVPIQQETHEVLLFDIKRHPKCGSRDPLDQALDMQAVMAAIARYFGGYTLKMQPMGERQVKQLREAKDRKVEGEPSKGAAEDFKKYARRLVKDLELRRLCSKPCSPVFVRASDVRLSWPFWWSGEPACCPHGAGRPPRHSHSLQRVPNIGASGAAVPRRVRS